MYMKTIHRSICAYILIQVLFIGCSTAYAQGPAHRIISLTPASTEILFALGLDDEIIGVSSYCNWPRQARAKEQVGSFSRANIEKIIALQPDLVVVTGMEQQYIFEILARLGIDHVSVDPSDLDELYASIRVLGDATAKKKEAIALISRIESTVDAISVKVAKIAAQARPKVYVEIWHDPIMSIGSGSFLDDMIEKAGGTNIMRDLPRSYSRVDPEQVIFRDPDIIILNYMKTDEWVRREFSQRLGWGGIAAVTKSHIYTDIDPDIILRPGPRVIQGLQKLYEAFYERG